MKVLLLTSSFPSESAPVDGIFVKELAEYLAEYGHWVHVVAPMTADDEEQVRQGERISVHKFKYFGFERRAVDATKKWIPVSALPFLGAMFIKGLSLIIKEKIDIIHCYWIIPAGFVGLLLKWLTGVPVVVSAPGSDLNVWSYRTIAGEFIRLTVKNIDYLFTLGTRLRERAIELGMRPDKVTALLGDGGMNPRLFHPLPKDRILQKSLRIPDKAFIALYIGRLSYPKRLDLVIPLLQAQKNVWFLVIGEGGDRQQYEALAKTCQVEKRVIFTGALPHEELPAYYSLADVILYPSENEGLPSTIMEGQCMGVPSIASAVGGIPDLIRSGENGYRVKNSAEAFKEAFAKIVGNRNLLKSMRKNALQFAQEKLLYTSITPQILKVYENCFKSYSF